MIWWESSTRTNCMNEEEISLMVADLEASRAGLIHSLRDATEADATRHPAPGRWSVLDCIEHLVIAEHYLLRQIMEAQQGEPVPDAKREERIRRYGADRSRPMQAPEGGNPTGRYQSLADSLRDFNAARTTTIRFVEGCDTDLRARSVSHPVLGTLNAWEMLLTIVAHPHRHAGQIREILQGLAEAK